MADTPHIKRFEERMADYFSDGPRSDPEWNEAVLQELPNYLDELSAHIERLEQFFLDHYHVSRGDFTAGPVSPHAPAQEQEWKETGNA